MVRDKVIRALVVLLLIVLIAAVYPRPVQRVMDACLRQFTKMGLIHRH